MSAADPDEDPTSPSLLGKPDISRKSKAAGSKQHGSLIPSKRSARNLNPDQLARKRANDREAQRAIRERTKSQIDTLETRIQELESGKAFQQLQDVIREKQQLQQENEDMRNRLEAVLGLVTPVAGRDKLPSDASDTRQPNAGSKSSHDAWGVPKKSTFSMVPSNQGDNRQGATRSTISELGDTMMTSDGDINTQKSSPDSQILRWLDEPNQIHGLHCFGSDPHGAEIDAWGPYIDHLQASAPGTAKRSMQSHHPGLYASQHDYTQALNVVPPYVSPGAIDPSIVSTPPTDPPAEPPAVETQLPYTCPPACRIDNILQDYCRSKRRQLADGATVAQIVGPPYADYTNLIYPDQPTNEHSISMLFIGIQRAFTAMEGWPERLGMISYSVLFMRWYICPTRESFIAMPDFMRPIDAQLRIQHPVWVDLLPWPQLRAKMVYHYTVISFDDFFMPYTSTLDANWPDGKDAMSCLDKHPEDGVLRMTPALAAHISVLGNWTLGPEFVEALPMLANSAPIKEGDKMMSKKVFL